MILLTRPYDLSLKTATKLKKIGYKVVIAPLLKIECREVVVEKYTDYDALIVTSQNATYSIKGISALYSKAIYVVGDATCKLLKDNGFLNVYSASGNAEALISMIKKKVEVAKNLVYLSGNHTAGNIYAILKEGGYNITQEIVYDSIDNESLPGLAGITDIMFFSVRTANVFSNLHQVHKYDISTIRALCISHNVADVVQNLGWHTLLTAEQPNESAMLEMLNAI